MTMKKIYGNIQVLRSLEKMASSGQTAHSMMICGEKGSGRKLIAKYYTMALMCESPVEGRPCGNCNACQNIEKGIHPDVVYPAKTGKLGNYSVSAVRDVISDAYIKPNNSSGCKVYIFADCRHVDQRTQNALLKLIEEPPEYAFFIFTCDSKYEFLPTVISRCVCFSTLPCTEEEAAESLAESGYAQQDIRAAVGCFHGNIGMCESYIEDGETKKRVDLTKSLADSIIEKNEYALSVKLSAMGGERNDVREGLFMLDGIVRDAAVLAKDSSARTTGCYREGAEALSHSLTAFQSARIHERIENAWKAIDSNVGISLTLTALGAEIMEIVG